jgi:hypothetical protein
MKLADTKFPYGYSGNPAGMGTMLTWNEMLTKSTVNKLHPEVRRRFKALIEYAASQGKPLGCGTGWRVQPANKPGFAKPGNSYHEGFPANGVAGNAMAIDTVPNVSWPWLESNCGKFGFRTFRNVNNEPWHIQPVEIRTSRNYATTAPALPAFNLPGTPAKPAGLPDVPTPTLKLGSAGTEVAELIFNCKWWKWLPANYVNDARFTTAVKTGVVNMQKAMKLQADGVYGPKTATAYQGLLHFVNGLG